MEILEQKLNRLRHDCKGRKIRIMIIGLGSVGNYLLDYLMSQGNEKLEICVVGRNKEKLLSDVNIVRVASLIRGQNRNDVQVIDGVDLNDVGAIAECLKANQPDIVVNSSRAYSGLKYGSISWGNVRAYGIWAPLSIKYIKNIMAAYEEAGCNAIVINTSYSDAVIPWLKSAGKAYPDFGSGNINHLLPRIRFAVAEQFNIADYWNIDITYAVSHFHDVVISKEGHTEGIEQLIYIEYGGKRLSPDMEQVFSGCRIPMPVDAKRNMMNASSNFEIIQGVLTAACSGERVKLHCPGAAGEIGGYPIVLDGRGENVRAYIDESRFSLEAMRGKNRESIYLDGIEDVSDGSLYYTDELIDKVHGVFGVNLMKRVSFEEIEDAAEFLIKEIIEKNR
ncbi:MAG: saccharopine dehydrogenase NADP-binding domain-containing protein [Butyrivibrio sp.]|nr:saccharopine dehydrogenase NADP-binding domain-containing protein [Muribaculum sp.]MCM1551368.1 saccharopine dehydrogenase NADP-binding domain-containing protein [Butyrivibrio sp.]